LKNGRKNVEIGRVLSITTQAVMNAVRDIEKKKDMSVNWARRLLWRNLQNTVTNTLTKTNFVKKY